MSILLIIPIVAIAAYMLYRHVKENFAGKKSCCEGSLRAKRRKRIFINKSR